MESIAAACALPGLEAEGIFTHFAVSDEDDRDSEAYTRARSTCSPVCWMHWLQGAEPLPSATAPTAALWPAYPEMYLDMVRPGIACTAWAPMRSGWTCGGDEPEVQRLHHQDL